MSHGGGQRIVMRAICAIASVCALVFALFLSAAPHRTMTAPSSASARALCHETVDATAADAAHDGAPETPAKGRTACPCCLAAHSGPAVLPERAVFAAPRYPEAAPAVYRIFPAAPPPFALSRTVNGARAPPSAAPIG